VKPLCQQGEKTTSFKKQSHLCMLYGHEITKISTSFINKEDTQLG
jgi:hypothetical protein